MAARGTHIWTPEEIERLRVLWIDEGKTSSEVGSLMGVSRNSIIGRVHRCGWSGLRAQRPAKRKRAKKVTLRKDEARKAAISEPKKVTLLPIEVPPPEPAIGSYTLMELRYGSCKWPEGERPPYSYCGARALEGGPYCEPHHKRAHHGPPVPRGTPSYMRWAAK